MPDSGVPHRGGSPVPPLHLRMNKNGFQVTHLTETQKEKNTVNWPYLEGVKCQT